MLFCHSLLASVLLLALCPSFPSALSPPPSSPFSPLLESSSNSVMHWCPSPSGVSTLLISNFNQNMKAHEWPPGSTQSKWPLDMLLSRQVAGLSFQDVKSLLWWHYTFACGFNQARRLLPTALWFCLRATFLTIKLLLVSNNLLNTLAHDWLKVKKQSSHSYLFFD